MDTNDTAYLMNSSFGRIATRENGLYYKKITRLRDLRY